VQDLTGRDFVALLDYEREELESILELAIEVRANPARFRDALAGRTLFMYFEKPSLRTRITFETGMTQMGGHAIHFSAADGNIGKRESVADAAKNLERWVDGAMCRTFSHQLVVDLARLSSIPVVNGLTDRLHPCQALADFQTLRQVRGELEGQKLVYVGDGNNVAHSLMSGGARFGCSVTVVCPKGYEPDEDILERCRTEGAATGATIDLSHDLAAVEGADAVYTDVWASMGQEKESEKRKKIFMPYQVDAALMARAKSDAVFMHCLPAHRGEEVTAEVADAPTSVIFQQAENRLHSQKAILLKTMAGI